MSDARTTLLLCKWLKDRIKTWETQAKAELSMRVSERIAGTVGDEVVGHVTMCKGARTAKVVNESALLAYVKANYPTEVETVEKVRPAFLDRLLSDVKDKGALVDSDGVVHEGLIEAFEGSPYPMSKLTDDADIVIAGLLKRGALTVDGLKALPKGDS